MKLSSVYHLCVVAEATEQQKIFSYILSKYKNVSSNNVWFILSLMCSCSSADWPQHVFLVLFWFPPQANQTLLPQLKASNGRKHEFTASWNSLSKYRIEKVSPISAHLKLKIFMDIDGLKKKKS